jgi:hypothetical protein
MHCPDALYLAEATSGQFRGCFDGLVGGAVRKDALMGHSIGYVPCIFARSFGEPNALALLRSQPRVIGPGSLRKVLPRRSGYNLTRIQMP